MKIIQFTSSQMKCRGYSLVELTMATATIATGLSAAASLTMTSVRIEETAYRKSRALAATEACARLWQLGLSPTQAATLIPGDPAIYSITFNELASDPAVVTPSDQGTPITNPANDLGTFESVSIRTTITVKDGENTSSARQTFEPLRVVR